MANLVERQIGPGPVPVWDIQTASAGQIDACCGLGRGVNLLDNAYWVSNQYIINQRMQLEYTGYRNSIDRWIIDGDVSYGFLTLDNQGISISHPTQDAGMTHLEQRLLHIPEGIYTFSVLTQDNILLSVSGDFSVKATATNGNKSISLLPSRGGYKTVWIGVTYGESLRPLAAKLELGSVQTLAHKEGDTLVLNAPPPNYQLELAKCQRYLQRIDTFSPLYAIWASGKEASVFITFNEMLVNPTFLSLDGIELRNSTGTIMTDAIFAQAQNSPRTIQIRASTTTTSMDKGYYITGTGLLTAEL